LFAGLLSVLLKPQTWARGEIRHLRAVIFLEEAGAVADVVGNRGGVVSGLFNEP